MDAITSGSALEAESARTPGAGAAGAGTAGEGLTIAALRAELGLTQSEFGERIGLTNKTSVSLLESGKRPVISAKVALAIEALSVVDGAARIDAGALCEDVKLARAQIISGAVSVHAPANTPNPVQDHG